MIPTLSASSRSGRDEHGSFEEMHVARRRPKSHGDEICKYSIASANLCPQSPSLMLLVACFCVSVRCSNCRVHMAAPSAWSAPVGHQIALGRLSKFTLKQPLSYGNPEIHSPDVRPFEPLFLHHSISNLTPLACLREASLGVVPPPPLTVAVYHQNAS